MTLEDFKKVELPDVPGIYRFVNEHGEILYVGKATSLKDRVRSYFDDDLIVTRGRRLVEMVALARVITFETTPSVLEALILEAAEIKRLLPHYNVKEKDNKSYNFVVITKEQFPKLITIRGRTLELAFPQKDILHVFGPFPNGMALREALKFVRKLFPYRDERCVPAAEQKNPTTPKPCFNYHIGLCPGACAGTLQASEYARTIRHIALLFAGKKSALITELEQDMHTAAKELRFEYASHIKKIIFSLEHINDMTIIKADEKRKSAQIIIDDAHIESDSASESGIDASPIKHGDSYHEYRIEAFDSAHTQGVGYVGVMVVLTDNQIDKKAYRTFHIKTQKKSNDTGALSEILRRRLTHEEWGWPDLIVVDGGVAQRHAAEKVCESLAPNKKPLIVSVVKDRSHKPKGFTFTEGEIAQNGQTIEAILAEYKKEILLANAESHRFALHFHRRARSKRLMR